MLGCEPGYLGPATSGKPGGGGAGGVWLVDAGPGGPRPTYPDGAVAPEPPGDDGPPVAPPPPSGTSCDERAIDAVPVYSGTPEPTFLDLSPGQIMAVGLLDLGGGLCSGTLIAPRWVMTAKHCTSGVDPSSAQFVIGSEPRPDRPIWIRRFVEHPSTDLSLVELDRDATAAAPEVVPVPILTEIMDRAWIGRDTEAGGYGRTERGSTGTRYFTSLPIRDLDSDLVYFDGGGSGGVCNGDSGGPLMARGSDGTARLIGAVSGGDGTCTYQAWFTRVDQHREWVEGYTGPTAVPPGDGCGGVTPEGRCMSGSAIWCEAGELRTAACGAGSSCAYDATARGYRCVPDPVDPPPTEDCGGVDGHGRCDGAVATWCDRGVLRRRDCAACGDPGTACGESAEFGGVYCVTGTGTGTDTGTGCGDLDYLGRCDGEVAVWCDSGMVRSRDCGAEGRTCGWVDDSTGYWCR